MQLPHCTLREFTTVIAASENRGKPKPRGVESAKLRMPRVPPAIPDPMLARLTDRLPIGPAWSYGVKWDGYCCLALKVGATPAI
jgi:ATP-dependent DNA ligase